MTLDLKKERAAICSAGQKHVVTVTEAGAVWEWRPATRSNRPRRISSLTNIAQVACGNYHTVALTKDGQLFTWGQNSSGQLGLGKGEPSSPSPRPLKSLCGIPLAQISAGGDHSFALSLSGAVFGWGRNGAGQLGLGDTDDRHAPVCVKSLNLKKAVSISCGEDHTAVLTKGGLLFTFGSGCYGQLGHNSRRDELLPRVVAEFWGSKVSQVACGGRHTLALVESSNTIYSFGRGEQGQLGNGLRTDQCVPFPVKLPPEFSPDQAIKKITAGGNLSLLFLSKTDDVQTSSNLSSCNTTAVLNDEMIDRWISPCNSKTWKRYKREIQKMFSSASCINGSFCEKSGDQHYKTSRLYSGLDLSLARLALEKLPEKDNVLSALETVVERDLLPSLSPEAAGVEALRVYLILPELLRVLKKQGRGTQLTVALARAILQLEPESVEVLTSLWTKLPYYYYRTLVKMFHCACAHYVSLRMKATCDHWTEVLPLLRVLRKLYNVNSQRAAALTDGYFLMKELNDLFTLMNQDRLRHLFSVKKLAEEDRTERLTCYRFILDLKSKQTAFQFLQMEHGLSTAAPNTLCVSRETVLAETLAYLETDRHNFRLPLVVKFNLEDGIDRGGVRAGFFTLLGQEITKDSSVIQAFEDSGLFWFSADSGSGQEEFFHFGVMCGLALYNHCFMNIGFPVVLFKKLLDLRPTLRDLEELSPVEARNLKYVLKADEDVVDVLYLDFTVKGKELILNGAEIPVTKANRQKYVDLYVDFVFNKSVEGQFRRFKEGFSRGSPFDLWRMFKPEELRDLLYGTSIYEWEELKRGVTYEHCGPSDELIRNFWSVFFELDEEHRKKFLRMTLDLKKERAAICSAGQKHVVTVTEAGAVWEWRPATRSNRPRRISSLTNIAQVACGNYHTVALTKDGQLFTWGQNSSGQLGLGKGEPSSPSPRPLKSLCGIPLAQISAGGDHSFALSLSGAVFGWGRNGAGQLGLGDTDDRHAPVCVKSLNLKKAVSISCGEDHTAVLTKGGLLFTFGSGRYGQLGHNSRRDELLPRVVAEFWGSKVSQVACGGHHTLALVESSNTIYSFGRGEQGQLGNGLRTDQCVPFPVKLPPEFSPDQAIKKITAGGNLSLLFLSKTDDVQTSSNLSSCNTTAVLNDEMIDRWISPCNSKTWKRYKREIQKMFSSASCINGSFCEKSGDQHYKTSRLYSGLDLSLARLALEKLPEKDNVLSALETVVERDLLPSLSPDAAGVEALRVYLILPELLRVLKKQGRGTQLTVALARAILQLEPESVEVLISLWTKLPYSYYRTLVKMFHSVCAQFFSLMTTTVCDHWTKISCPLRVLQKLYNVNSQRDAPLPEDYFLVKELNDFFTLVGHRSIKGLFFVMRIAEEDPFLLNANEQLGVVINVLQSTILFTSYPFILDINSKYITFRFLQLHYEPTFVFDLQNTLYVNRETVLTDTLKYLKKGGHDFSLPLKVMFDLEDGLDYGGVRAGFFTLLGQEITTDSRVIQVSEDSGLFWFSADSESGQEEFFHFGVMCGLAFYNRCYMNIGFPVVLFKKLLDLRPTLRDLEELSPVEARCLKNLLTEDEDVVEALYLDFTVKGKELIPNGAEIPVTKANRQKCVDLYVDFVFNKSVESQFKKFKEGFSRGNPYELWEMFKPEELRDLLYGTSEYEWEELQKGVIYERCGPSDELVQNFWSVFFKLDEEHRKTFL
ncbi:putative E3 ubiquitin-protein ligase HERC3, partial [Clarias magur]